MTVTVRAKPETIRSQPLLKALERLAELQDAAREYERLSAMVKAEMKEKGEGAYRCGQWKIEVRNVERTAYEVPSEIKEQYRTKSVAVFVEWEKR